MIAVARRIARFQLIALRVAASFITTLTTAIRSFSACRGCSVSSKPAGGSPIIPRTRWQSRQLFLARTGW